MGFFWHLAYQSWSNSGDNNVLQIVCVWNEHSVSSGKSRTLFIDHWGQPVLKADNWKKNAQGCEDLNPQPQVSLVASFAIPPMHHIWLGARCFSFEVTLEAYLVPGQDADPALNVTLYNTGWCHWPVLNGNVILVPGPTSIKRLLLVPSDNMTRC